MAKTTSADLTDVSGGHRPPTLHGEESTRVVPFNYDGAWVEPAYNQDYNNRGFWFFGIWIPL